MTSPTAVAADSTAPVLPARSLDEAYEYASTQPCECGVAAEPAADLLVTDLDGGYRLDFPCRACGRARRYVVALTERPNLPGEEFAYSRAGRPSRLLDGGDWVLLLRRYYEGSTALLDELAGQAPDDSLAPTLARCLARAAAAADEALALLPEGADAMPDAEVSTAAGRALRAERPELFSRAMLELGPVRCRERLVEVMAAYQDQLGCLGTRLESLTGEVLPYGTRQVGQPLPARTYWEALYHSRSVDCRCGSNRTDTRRTSLLIEGQLLTRLFGACDGCGRPREFLYRNLADPIAELSMDAAWTVDGRPSRLFDAGAFVGLAAVLGELAAVNIAADPVGQWHGIRHHLWLSAEAVDEALALMPPGALRIPADQLWHPLGRQQAAERPATMERDYLEQQREAARRALADFTARYPRPADPPEDVPLRPRSVEERALYLALNPCECGEQAFHPDELTLVTVDSELIGRERGACGSCGRTRAFEFARSEQANPPNLSGSWTGPGSDRSETVDAGQWLRVSDEYHEAADTLAAGGEPGRQLAAWTVLSGGTPRQLLWMLLARSASAVDEALLFLEPGADELPASAFWTEEGRRARRQRPDSFTRPALQALRDQRRSRVPQPRQSQE